MNNTDSVLAPAYMHIEVSIKLAPIVIYPTTSRRFLPNFGSVLKATKALKKLTHPAITVAVLADIRDLEPFKLMVLKILLL